MKMITDVMGDADRYLRGLLLTENEFFTAFTALAKDHRLFMTAKRIYDTFGEYGELGELEVKKLNLAHLMFEAYLDYPSLEPMVLEYLKQDRFYAFDYDVKIVPNDSFLIGLFSRLSRVEASALEIFPLTAYPDSFNAVSNYLLSAIGIEQFSAYINSLRTTDPADIGSQLDVWKAVAGFIHTLPADDQRVIIMNLDITRRRTLIETDMDV